MVTAQVTALHEHNIASDPGAFLPQVELPSVIDGVLLRGGDGTSYIMSRAISVAGAGEL